VSRLSRQDAYKGIDVLIRALALLKGCGHRVVLDVVGDGDDRSRLEGLAASLGLATAVQFHTSVSDSQMYDFYSRCTLFALPSRREGFGIVFLEAMLHGKPCVGGRHGGTPEVIDHDCTGYLVSHGDVAELATRLSDLLEGSHKAGRMGALGLAKVQTVYRFEQMQAAWVKIMNGALNGAAA
jgi:glycosyltransferase involved in cell wall biosynthesis